MTARGRTLVCALVVATAAGCGGGSSEERGDLRHWTAAVDEICRATRERIAERGDARDAVDLQSVAAQASDDVRAAIKRIRAVPISAATHRRVRPFLAELERDEPQLGQMTRITADGTLDQIARAGIRVADATKRMQDRADAAGLRECSDTRQFDAVLDAFTAPVYATKVARLEIWLVRKLEPLTDSPSLTSPELARYLHRVGGVFEQAERRMTDFTDYRPNRAVEAADDLEFALHDYEDFLHGVGDALRGGRRVLTPVGVKQFERDANKYERKMRRALAKLKRAIGADPLVDPGGRSVLDSEEESA